MMQTTKKEPVLRIFIAAPVRYHQYSKQSSPESIIFKICQVVKEVA
jgi:hypothetical protein